MGIKTNNSAWRTSQPSTLHLSATYIHEEEPNYPDLVQGNFQLMRIVDCEVRLIRHNRSQASGRPP